MKGLTGLVPRPFGPSEERTSQGVRGGRESTFSYETRRDFDRPGKGVGATGGAGAERNRVQSENVIWTRHCTS